MEGKRKVYTVPELARETKMSAAFWRKRIWFKEIEVQRFGRAVRISQDSLDRYMSQQQRRAA